jgi:hypothetical protein
VGLVIYGASDDLVEVEGDVREEFNPGDGPSYLAVSDGTVLRIAYDGRWRIDRIAEGGAAVYEHILAEADEGHRDDAHSTPAYSDVVMMDDHIRLKWVVFGDRFEAAK